jgi:hypothetical protein
MGSAPCVIAEGDRERIEERRLLLLVKGSVLPGIAAAYMLD